MPFTIVLKVKYLEINFKNICKYTKNLQNITEIK